MTKSKIYAGLSKTTSAWNGLDLSFAKRPHGSQSSLGLWCFFGTSLYASSRGLRMVDKIIFQKPSIFERIAWSFLIISVSFSLSEGLRRFLSPDGPPVSISATEAINSPVHIGEPLKVRIIRDKTRDDCSLRSERTAQNEDGKNYDLGVVFYKGGSSKTDSVVINYPTSSLSPGRYHLKVKLAYICPERVYHVTQPDTRFRVL